MSADNGVYILQTLGKGEDEYEFRVRHLQAVENYVWDDKLKRENWSNHDIHIANAREMWAGCKVFYTMHEALDEAEKIYEEIMLDDFCPVCEYGICFITIDREF